MRRLRAMVTGASRGVGRGVAEAFGEAGGIVYLTGRDAPALEATAARVRALGGRAFPLPCDHTEDVATDRVFEAVHADGGALDVLVNNAWAGYERMVEDGTYTWEAPFWQQPRWRFDAMFAAGVRTAYICAQLAAQEMVTQGRGLIVNISSWAARKYTSNTAYGMSKAATDRMTADMAHELAPHGVATVSLYPGLVRTEKVMEASEHLDLSNSESPRFVGRVVSALATDPELAERSGQALVAAEVAREYGVTDVDGRSPRPLTLDKL